jgi:predicted SAM-dependent methyltransferase
MYYIYLYNMPRKPRLPKFTKETKGIHHIKKPERTPEAQVKPPKTIEFGAKQDPSVPPFGSDAPTGKEEPKSATPFGKKPDSEKSMVVNLQDPIVDVKGIKINMGCGEQLKPDFLNVDPYYKGADANWDIREIPLNDNSVALIMCYHTIEHLPIMDVYPALLECHRVLKPKGKLMMTTPNIIDVAEKLVADPHNEWILNWIYGNQSREGQGHQSGFTSRILGNHLGRAGFVDVKMAYFEDSGFQSIYVEAIK